MWSAIFSQEIRYLLKANKINLTYCHLQLSVLWFFFEHHRLLCCSEKLLCFYYYLSVVNRLYEFLSFIEMPCVWQQTVANVWPTQGVFHSLRCLDAIVGISISNHVSCLMSFFPPSHLHHIHGNCEILATISNKVLWVCCNHVIRDPAEGRLSHQTYMSCFSACSPPLPPFPIIPTSAHGLMETSRHFPASSSFLQVLSHTLAYGIGARQSDTPGVASARNSSERTTL